MRNIIYGAIGTLWGGAILVYSFVRDKPEVNESVRVGQMAGTGFGFLLFAVGLYYLIQGIRANNQPKPTKKLKKKKQVG